MHSIKHLQAFNGNGKIHLFYSIFVDNGFRYLISENDKNAQQTGFLSPNRTTSLSGKDNPSGEV